MSFLTDARFAGSRLPPCFPRIGEQREMPDIAALPRVVLLLPRQRLLISPAF
jgi:hypothetical protein